MKRTLWLLLFLLPLNGRATALSGRARLDSLRHELTRRPAADTARVKLLIDVCRAYAQFSPDTGVRYARAAEQLATRVRWPHGAAEATLCASALRRVLSDYVVALALARRAEHLYRQLGEERNYARALSLQTSILFDQGNNVELIEVGRATLPIFERLGDSVRIADLNRLMGLGYMELDQLTDARRYMHRALVIYQRLGARQEMSYELLNLGDVLTREGHNGQALPYYARALAIMRQLDDRVGIQFVYGARATAYRNLGRYVEALAWADSCIRVCGPLGYRRGAAGSLAIKGDVYRLLATDTAWYRHHPVDKPAALTIAIGFYRQALTTDSGSAGDFFNQRDIYKGLYQAYRLTGRPTEALDAHIHYTAALDSIFSRKAAIRLARNETQATLTLKDRELRLSQLAVRRKQEQQVYLVGGLTLLLAFGGFAWRSYRTQRRVNGRLAAEQQRSEELLLNILPAEIAEELKARGSAEARHYDEVSVLFTDFVNFTSTAEKLSPQELVTELDVCFTVFDEIIGRHGIEKIKTIGDAYMAVGGLPTPHANHAGATVGAALDIRDFITARHRQGGPFEIRVGVHTGPVVAGIVGVKKFAYDIWGDTVNMAARMESSSTPGAVNISQSTYELVKDNFACTPRGRIVAKNKGEVEMYFVRSAAA